MTQCAGRNAVLQGGIATQGDKFDEGKARYDLVPPEGIHGVAQVLTYGASKYGDRNWERGIEYGRLFAATMRHMWSWWRGEVFDRESGHSHLAHAATNIFMLMAFESRLGHASNGMDPHARTNNAHIDQ